MMGLGEAQMLTFWEAGFWHWAMASKRRPFSGQTGHPKKELGSPGFDGFNKFKKGHVAQICRLWLKWGWHLGSAW